MTDPQYKRHRYTCSSCGELILEVEGENFTAKVHSRKIYCGNCYYKEQQAKKQLLTRIQFMKDHRVKPEW